MYYRNEMNPSNENREENEVNDPFYFFLSYDTKLQYLLFN